MKLLATLKADDVESDAPHFYYASFKPRRAGRAIIFDKGKVALIYVARHGYYMLPGGGIEDEDIVNGLKREIIEELGIEIELKNEVGAIVVYFDRWSKKQTDYCYTADKIGPNVDNALTDFELEEVHEVVWAQNIQEAIRMIDNTAPVNRDGKLVSARDRLFLLQVAAEHAQ